MRNPCMLVIWRRCSADLAGHALHARQELAGDAEKNAHFLNRT